MIMVRGLFFFFFTVIKTHNTFYLQTLCIYY